MLKSGLLAWKPCYHFPLVLYCMTAQGKYAQVHIGLPNQFHINWTWIESSQWFNAHWFWSELNVHLTKPRPMWFQFDLSFEGSRSSVTQNTCTYNFIAWRQTTARVRTAHEYNMNDQTVTRRLTMTAVWRRTLLHYLNGWIELQLRNSCLINEHVGNDQSNVQIKPIWWSGMPFWPWL